MKILANPIMTFPIKKRINTELFINGKYELYINKGKIKDSRSDLLERDTENWLRSQNTWEYKPITGACLSNYGVTNKNL